MIYMYFGCNLPLAPRSSGTQDRPISNPDKEIHKMYMRSIAAYVRQGGEPSVHLFPVAGYPSL